MKLLVIIENYGFIDFLESLGIIIASCVAIWGINSWRREAKWKRKYELAEEVLANLYESHQAIRIIRSPIGFGGEGKSRIIGEKETSKETEIYNQAYVARERFERNNSALKKLHSLKFRFIALYGKEYEKYFDKFSHTINIIFFASDQIARVKLGEYSDDLKLKGEILKECRSNLYAKIDGNDDIEIELQSAIKEIENVCRKVIGKIS